MRAAWMEYEEDEGENFENEDCNSKRAREQKEDDEEEVNTMKRI